MKNRILAALLALVLGVPLYLLAADAVPTAAAKTVSSAAPAQAVALLKALPSVEDLAAAMTPEADAAAMIAQTRADLQREIERQTGPKGIDLSWWQSHYNDIIGYIYSPGTPISYPIAYDGNNEYYLHHDLYGNYSEYGTIFLDARVPSDFSGHNNVLYGHHMSDGSMFASISNYKQQWYYDAHPYFFLYTNAGKYRVDLFAGIVVPGTHEVFSTSLSADQLQRFINNSTFYSGKGVPSGQIVTLCTCSYEAANYRYVVLGELVKLEDARRHRHGGRRMTHEEQQALFDTILRRANLPGSFNVENGIRLTSLSDGGAEGEVRLTAGHLNPLGIVHGGVYCTLLDQVAGAAACTRGSRGLTVNCETRFLGIAQGDVLCGHAQAIHMGRTLVVMHAWVTDSQDTLCADGTYTFRMKPGFPED